MTKLSEADLGEFKEAIYKDYGIKISDKNLYQSAYNLLQFIESLIKYDNTDRKIGSKSVQETPLNTPQDITTMEEEWKKQ